MLHLISKSVRPSVHPLFRHVVQKSRGWCNELPRRSCFVAHLISFALFLSLRCDCGHCQKLFIIRFLFLSCQLRLLLDTHSVLAQRTKLFAVACPPLQKLVCRSVSTLSSEATVTSKSSIVSKLFTPQISDLLCQIAYDWRFFHAKFQHSRSSSLASTSFWSREPFLG